jgi:hypothetical protein
MTFEQDISDTRELVERYPEKCDAYIGVSQLVDNRRPAGIARDWLVDEITEDNNPDDLEHLEQIPHLEDSAHLPLLGERDRFSQVTIDLKHRPTRSRSGRTAVHQWGHLVSTRRRSADLLGAALASVQPGHRS